MSALSASCLGLAYEILFLSPMNSISCSPSPISGTKCEPRQHYCCLLLLQIHYLCTFIGTCNEHSTSHHNSHAVWFTSIIVPILFLVTLATFWNYEQFVWCREAGEGMWGCFSCRILNEQNFSFETFFLSESVLPRKTHCIASYNKP